MAGRDGFPQLLRAEWTKFRSVRRWVLGLLAIVPLTVALSVLTAAGSGSDMNDHPEELGPIGPHGEPVTDALNYVYQPLDGDGSITARVVSLTGHEGFTHEWAKAGVMIRASGEPGARYAAIMVTPGHGVRLQANYSTDLAGSDGTTPRWLRLTRTGDSVTGYESDDGTSWREAGTVSLDDLPSTVEIGMFATSPERLEIESSLGSASVGSLPAPVTGTFDNVHVDSPRPDAPWQERDTSMGLAHSGGSVSQAGGVVTITGSGDIGPNPPHDDVAQLSLIGIQFGQIAAIAIGVLFITSEYRRGMIRTTFAASPRRGRVLVAKAIVLGGVTLAVGLVAVPIAFLLSQPILRTNGFGPPAYAIPSLTDAAVLRAVVGSAVFLALTAVLGLGVGAILRRSIGAITALILAMFASGLLVTGLPLSVAQWVMRTTPAAGLSITQTIGGKHNVTPEPWSMAPPLVGLGVLAAWAVAALAVAVWLTSRRDA